MRSRIMRTGVLGAMAVVLLLLAISSGSLGPHLAIAAAPGNDDFASAVSASPLPFSDTQFTADATLEGGEPAPFCQGSLGHTVWYNFTPAADGTYQVDTLSSDYDTVAGVYTGATLATLSSVACNDDTSGGIGTGVQSRVTFNVTGGTTYSIQVGGYNTHSGNLHVHLALAGATIIVNSTADTDARDSVLTLREAMAVANGTLAPAVLTGGECTQIGGAFTPPCTVAGGLIGAPASDTIAFDAGVFPPGSPATITLSSTLPAMDTGDDTVSGSGAGIIVDGVTKGFDCFAMTGANPNGNTVKGLQITRCNNGVSIAGANNSVGDAGAGAGIGERNVISKGNIGVGISGAAASGNFVRNNFIGTDVTGAIGGFGNATGVLVSGAPGELIGGTDQFARNVISENSSANIETTGAASTGNVIAGNYIGTNASGTAGLPGNGYGVSISGGSGNLIGGVVGTTSGGPCTGACNVISGNVANGVQFTGASGNMVEGNFIGTNAAGTAAIGNTTGVSISGGSGNVIGGIGMGNLISGNPFAGVDLTLGTTGNHIADNLIGTNAAGTGAIANGDGVNIESVSGNYIELGNVISGNVNGVEIDGAPATGNVVQTNKIGTNAAGTGAVANTNDGVKIDAGASGNTVGGTVTGTGNLISGNGHNGVEINGAGAAGNVVAGNLIGTDASGDPPIPNTGDGVKIDSSPNNTIGGTAGTTPGGPCTGACNVISGNSGNGVNITGASSTGNNVQGDYIGTDVSGAIGVGNTASGVRIGTNASSNTVGGATAAALNVISKNGSVGVEMNGSGSGNLVEGNYIGTNADGTAALGNMGYGIAVFNGAVNNTIGGLASGDRNIISGNVASGVLISDSTTTGNVLENNYIGLNAAGTAILANTGIGVWIFESPGNSVGTTSAGGGNVIAGNGSDGVTIQGGGGFANNNLIANNTIGMMPSGAAASNGGIGVKILDGTGNTVTQNGINANTGLGIDLNSDGATPNDAGDPDTGPNNLQNFPVLTSVATSGGSTTIEGTLNSTASTAFTIEFFSNPVCDGSGNGEGQVFLGSLSPVTTDGGGNVSFTKSGLPAVTVGQVVTATATRNGAPLDTSEFSTCLGVCSGSGPDADADGVCDSSDNCPNWANPTQALPAWPVPAGDSDCDGFPDSVPIAPPDALSSEAHVGTDPVSHCAADNTRNNEDPPDRWPVDFDDNQLVNGSDLLTFAPTFGKSLGDPGYDGRFDLNNDDRINGSDLLKIAPFIGKHCV